MRVWVSFGPSSAQLSEGVGHVLRMLVGKCGGLGPVCSRPSCETVGKSLLSGALLPCLGQGDNDACPSGLDRLNEF